MAGHKRASDTNSSRPAKAAKIEDETKQVKNKNSKNVKATVSRESFLKSASNIYVALTHGTVDAGNPDESATEDSSSLGKLILSPTIFTTGSFGWKGSKRLTIVIQNTDAEDQKEKVQVMLNINATVLGSKPIKSDDEGKDAGKDEGDIEVVGGDNPSD